MTPKLLDPEKDGQIYGSANSSLASSDEEPVRIADDGIPAYRTGTNVSTATCASMRSDFEIQETFEEEIIQILSVKHKTYTTPLPSMGAEGRPLPDPLPDRRNYKVDFSGPQDPMHPHNWSKSKKLISAFCLSFLTTIVCWGSSVLGPCVEVLAEQYQKKFVVAMLAVSLYVLGFASGPILWGPLSEQYGRRAPVLIGGFGVTIFSFATGSSHNMESILITRFFSGFFSASPVVIVPAILGDIYETKVRGIAIVFFAMSVFAGPLISPVAGGFICFSSLGWRWTQYLTGIPAAIATVMTAYFYEESYPPAILAQKAKELRERTGIWGIYSDFESVELNVKEILTNSLLRPMSMLCSELILLLITLYTGFIYGILYLSLQLVPAVFQGYGFKGGVLTLPYLGLFLGNTLACLVILFYFEPRFNKQLEKQEGAIVPEQRLPPMMLGAILFPIGIVWFCWTGTYPDKIHWIVPILAELFIGAGMVLLFMPSVNYIVDAYILLAASALSGNMVLRCLFGFAFPLFGHSMLEGIGIRWTGTFVFLVTVVLAPVPFLFYIYGSRIRANSKYIVHLRKE